MCFPTSPQGVSPLRPLNPLTSSLLALQTNLDSTRSQPTDLRNLRNSNAIYCCSSWDPHNCCLSRLESYLLWALTPIRTYQRLHIQQAIEWQRECLHSPSSWPSECITKSRNFQGPPLSSVSTPVIPCSEETDLNSLWNHHSTRRHFQSYGLNLRHTSANRSEIS